MEQLQLDISGMSCEHCVRAVRGALERMQGVRVDRVEVGSATVHYDPHSATPEQIVDAINDEGYSAQAA
ncbi:MAG TPA: heavy metal-associated domain-containing protein [Gemmatimonadaceae bacterium]|nr:heavy metal-associated domain-containing protein [Gemmatimonadaceae bacterium]